MGRRPGRRTEAPRQLSAKRPVRYDDSVTAKPLHALSFISFDSLRCCGADCPIFAPCALQVWGCLGLAVTRKKKLCQAHVDHFSAKPYKNRHNLCMMRVVHGKMPFHHGINARDLGDNTTLDCVAGMPCSGSCHSIKPASKLRLARDHAGKYAKDKNQHYLFHHVCAECNEKASLPLPKAEDDTVRFWQSSWLPRAAPLLLKAVLLYCVSSQHLLCTDVILSGEEAGEGSH